MDTSGTISSIPPVSSGSVHTRPDAGARPTKKQDTNKTSVAPQEQVDKAVTNVLTNQDLQSLTEDLNNHVKLFNTKVSFSIDKATGQTVIHIRDAETDKILREVPAEDMLKLAAKLSEIIGIIIDKKV